VAVILEVPMQECPACGERWIDGDVARRLDDLLNSRLSGDTEIAIRRFDATDATTARARESR
jgi:hypothetical protein